MRICLINLGALPALDPAYKDHRVGGEEVQHALLAPAYRRAGHDVTLITGDFGQPAEYDFEGIRILKYTGIAGLIRALGRSEAQCYYYSCAGRLLGLLALYCMVVKRRFVFRVASDADCDPKRVEIRRPWDKWLYHFGLHRADEILVQTERQRVDLMRCHGLQSELASMLVERPAPEPEWYEPAMEAEAVARFIVAAASLPKREPSWPPPECWRPASCGAWEACMAHQDAMSDVPCWEDCDNPKNLPPLVPISHYRWSLERNGWEQLH